MSPIWASPLVCFVIVFNELFISEGILNTLFGAYIIVAAMRRATPFGFYAQKKQPRHLHAGGAREETWVWKQPCGLAQWRKNIDSNQALEERKIQNKANGLVLYYLQRRWDGAFWKRFELDTRKNWFKVRTCAVNPCAGESSVIIFS